MSEYIRDNIFDYLDNSKECNNFEEVLASELSEVVRETIESLA